MTRGVVLASLLCGMFAAVPSTGFAQGFVERIEHPALQLGKTTRVTLVGSGFGKALDLWTSLPGGTIKAKPLPESDAARAVFDVTVAPDAPVGIAGLRIATEDGLTNAALFLVDDLPVAPAPIGETPAKVALPAALWGRFREANVDRFVIHVAAGQRICFEAVGNRFGKDVDPLIVIRDPRGKLVAERDNDPGLYFDCRFAHTFAEAGPHVVEMRDARFFGSPHGQYVLRMGRFPAEVALVPAAVKPGEPRPFGSAIFDEPLTLAVRKAPAHGLAHGAGKRAGDDGSAWWPLETTDAEATEHREPSGSMDRATPAKVPGVLCGILRKPGDRHFFRFDLAKGQKIRLLAEAKAFNSPADLDIAVVDAAGKELRRAGENQQEEIILDFQANNPGPYGIAVRDLHRDGGPAFAYRIEVAAPQPRISLVAETEGLTVPRGSHQPIPIVASRTEHSGPIVLALVGAPAGVTLAPSEIPEGINAIVCKLSASPDAPLGAHTLQIVARPKIDDAAPTLVRTRPLIDRQLMNVDLIVYALREDQRRLPPALADRFALQIAPPAPFEMDLPEALATLPRYQHAEFPIAIKRNAGFAAPISFRAKGGQIAAKEEGRTRVYAEIPDATEGKNTVTGAIHSRILTNLQKHRVEVTATGIDRGRKISLTRTFDLDVRTAFAVSADPPLLKLEPGMAGKVRLTLERSKMFDGDVRVELAPTQGLEFPATATFPKGTNGIDIEVKANEDRNPGRFGIQMHAAGTVNGFEEEQRNRFEVEVFKTPPPKKK